MKTFTELQSFLFQLDVTTFTNVYKRLLNSNQSRTGSLPVDLFRIDLSRQISVGRPPSDITKRNLPRYSVTFQVDLTVVNEQ